MEINLNRTHRLAKSTLGILSVDSNFQCYTVEDVEREPGVKIAGQTAIPRGRYEVTVTYSTRFHKPLPLLMNVPMFEGIRIHPGNTAQDTEGCILVGNQRDIEAGTVQSSVAAFAPLMDRITEALKTEKIYITVE